MSIQLIEEMIESLDGEWVSRREIAAVTGTKREDIGPIMDILMDMGLVNQRVQGRGQFAKYLYRRARVICPRCGYDSHD